MSKVEKVIGRYFIAGRDGLATLLCERESTSREGVMHASVVNGEWVIKFLNGTSLPDPDAFRGGYKILIPAWDYTTDYNEALRRAQAQLSAPEEGRNDGHA